jgi:predicted dehydrogenase
MALKIAIVGCGKIADGHVEEIQKMPEIARVVGVCDLELLMAEQVAVRYGIPGFFDSLDALLASERPDVVHITTPPGSHLALAKKAVDAGCHVYVEKPLTLNHADSKALVDYVEKSGKKLTIGYSYLFDPPALEMRDLISRGALGDAIHVESFYGYNLAGPFGAAIMGDPAHWVHRLPGKLFHNNIDHLLYKVTEFLEDDEPEIIARGWAQRSGRFGDGRDALCDELRVMIRGKRTSVFGTFSSHIKPAGHFARVYGTKNTMHVDYVMRTVALDAQTTLPSAIGRLVPAFDQGVQYLKGGAKNLARFAKADFHYFSGMNRLFRMFYESIEQGGPPPISHRDILRISSWMDEIFRQVPQTERAT